MTLLHSVLYPLRLVRARLGSWSGPVVLVVLGIAAGASVVVGGRTGALVAQDRAVAQAVERIPDGSRSVRAVWFGIPAQSAEPQPVLERRARAALRHAVAGDARALVLFRESTIGGTFAGLGGVEGLGTQVILRSGRLPAECRPERCEVLRLRGAGGRVPKPAGLNLVEVGTGALKSRLLFGDFLAPTDNALEAAEVSPSFASAARYHRPAPPPLFLAEGVKTLAGARALDVVFRSYAWVVPLEAGRPRLWEVDDLAAGVARARSELQAVTSSFDLVAPVEELREAQATSRAAGRRLGHRRRRGGRAAVRVRAAGGDDASHRPRRCPPQARLVRRPRLAARAADGCGVGRSRPRGHGRGGRGGRARRGVRRPQGRRAGRGDPVPQRFLVPGARARAARCGRRDGCPRCAVASRSSRVAPVRFSLVDAAALAAILLVLLELWRGDDEGDLVLLLPALVTFAAAVLVGRALRPALRLAERLARGRSLGVRLASLSLSRNPGYAVVATAFLVVSFGLALFAESYRATLARGERDQAAHRVPLDYVVREDLRRLIPVQDAASFDRFRQLGVERAPVLRVTGSVARLEGESGITLLGLPPATLPELHGWRDSDAPASRPELVRRIAAAPADERAAPARDLTRLRFVAKCETSGPGLRGDRGARTVDSSAWSSARPIPPEGRGGRLAGIVDRAGDTAAGARRGRGQALTGSVELPVPDLPGVLDGWVGFGGARLDGRHGPLHARATLSRRGFARASPRRRARARARDAEARRGCGLRRGAAAADRGRAHCGASRRGRCRRFPGVDGQAVVGDGDALAAVVNLATPGAARVNEAWLGLRDPSQAAAVDRALAAKPFNVLAIESRRALEADARRDPIAHGTLIALAVAAAVALLLALAGILLTVVGDLRDERGELFDLEAQGASPSLLRRIVRLRAASVAVAGLVAGALTGVALAAVVTDLVGLTARATAAEPPLVLAVDVLAVLGAALVYVVIAAVLVLVVTRRAFTAAVPGRVEAME